MTKWLAVTAALLVVGTQALADDCGGTLLPPAAYDHNPSAFVKRVYYDAVGVDRTCRNLGAEGTRQFIACTVCHHSSCVEVLPQENGYWDARDFPCLRRHEDGHVNIYAAMRGDSESFAASEDNQTHEGWH